MTRGATPIHSRAAHMARTGGNPRKKNGSRRRKAMARVLAAYDTCDICGQPVDKTLPPGQPGSPEVDEIIPVSRGGSPYDPANLRLSHRWCNVRRGNRSLAWARRVIGPEARGEREKQQKNEQPFETS